MGWGGSWKPCLTGQLILHMTLTGGKADLEAEASPHSFVRNLTTQLTYLIPA
jgi:hypothetical protein